MKTLVIPDVHQKVEWVCSILEREKYDEVVFLGDWVDTLESPPAVFNFRETCAFLRDLSTSHSEKDKFVFLIGNHDLQYMHLNCKPSTSSVVAERAYYCSGFTKNKAREWRKVFYDEGLRDDFFWRTFRVSHLSQGYVFSHAGISEKHLSYGETVESFVNKSCQEAWYNYRQLTHPKNYILTDVGECRGGDSSIGGVLWLDWRHEFQPSPQIGRQILGHTTLPEPQIMGVHPDCESWNLDTGKHYAMISDGKVEIRRCSS